MFKATLRLPLLLIASAAFLGACGDDADYCAELAEHCSTCDIAAGKATCDSHVQVDNQDVCKADLDGQLCQ